MKDAIFLFAMIGAIISWITWGSTVCKVKDRCTVLTAFASSLGFSVFAIVWAIVYGS